jgi:hypothetical protein
MNSFRSLAVTYARAQRALEAASAHTRVLPVEGLPRSLTVYSITAPPSACMHAPPTNLSGHTCSLASAHVRVIVLE